MKKQDKEKIYLRSMVLVLGLTCFGLVANYTGMQGLSGQGVGGDDQVGCGGDMSGYAVGTENTADEAIAETNEVMTDQEVRPEAVMFYYNDAEWGQEFQADEDAAERAESAEGPCGPDFVATTQPDPNGDGSVVIDALRCIFVQPTVDEKDAAMAEWAQVAHDNPDHYFDDGVPAGTGLQKILEDIFAEDIANSANMGVEHPGLKSADQEEKRGIGFDAGWGKYCGPKRGFGNGWRTASGPGIRGLDEACKNHDRCVSQGLKGGCGCDNDLKNAARMNWNSSSHLTNGKRKCAFEQRVCTKRKWGRCKRWGNRWVADGGCRAYSGAVNVVMSRCPNRR